MSGPHKARPRSAFRPQLESLEDRSLLSFGVGGIAVTNIGGDDRAWGGGALQPDGKIVAAGFTWINGSGTSQDFALVRWNADGSLDTGFGQGGKVITNMSTPTFESDRIFGVSLQADGKIVASGDAFISRKQVGVALARYNSDGTLDTSFGNKGKVFTSGATGRDNVVQTDGKIVVVGTSGDFSVFRYDADGALDNSFGSKGKVFTDFGGNERPDAVVLQADGRIVVAGRRVSGDQDIAVARYNSDGSLDTTFGAGGKVITDLGPGNDNASALALQSDGRIVVVGRIDGETEQGKFALVRYKTDGSLDTSFDGDGIVTVEFIGPSPSFDEGSSVAIQADGKIVVGGVGDNDYLALARLNSDGSLDPTFGTDGKVTTNINGEYQSPEGLGGLFVQPSDQKLVGVGVVSNNSYDFVAVRYNPDGSLDAGAGLHASTTADAPVGSKPLRIARVRPLLNQALSRWQAAGVDTSGLGRIDVRITNLGGTTLGLASEHTITLDDNAAGWGWFVDRTPRGDREFSRPGNQGERNRMDLLTVLMHEVGHLLGHDHEEGGVMAETLATGTRVVPVAESPPSPAISVEGLLNETSPTRRRA